jgi:biopolymer transport protein ExbD
MRNVDPPGLSVPPPSRTPDGPALLSLLLLAAGLLLLQSRFFTTAGLVLDLPHSLPALATPAATADALVVRDRDRYILGGALLDGASLAAALAERRAQLPGAGHRLLLHCDRRAPMESFLRAAEAAAEAGFESVQVAISTPPQ